MEVWCILLVTLSTAALLKALINLLIPKKLPNNLPPGPFTIPIISNILWLFKAGPDVELILRPLHAKLGPLVTLHIGSGIAIFVSDRALAYQTLVQNGAVFSDRPRSGPVARINNSNQHNINSAAYGPTWRLLRRNLTAEILHPSRVKSYSHARSWVLNILMDRLKSEAAKSVTEDVVIDKYVIPKNAIVNFMVAEMGLDPKVWEDPMGFKPERLAGFTLSCAILNHQLHYSKSFCHLLKEMEFWFIILISISIAALLKVLINFAIPTTKPTNKLPPSPFTIPIITNILWLGKSFSDLEPILRSLYAKLGPVVTLHIGPRTAIFVSDRFLTHQALVQNGVVFADRPPPGAFDQILHCNQHNINSASYGPTWRILRRNISAEILHPSRRMPYLKAVILEGLRRHPPAHFVLPHAVTEDTMLDNYLIPKNGVINFAVAEMGWDPKVWEDPMSFKPERFMSSDDGGAGEAFDITGSKEIKMMPFGAGRRMCPEDN
ncbi:hypothetical protein HS088_TW15G00803 [Tripterygium wilfordii]|uniref:Cytochrome P450 n=1 Tax=Tripterygium wilfordii TaxID=458696 RepID=A0A7J7CMP1_TRIWF|nr:hypothetical protein HS088_TW15G00803 [Tripterygium wilfordii]